MKIVFTGSGTGGHFYPLIAVAEAVHKVVAEKQLVEPQLYQFAPTAFDQDALFANRIELVKIPAGKVRRYFSLQNFTDIFVTISGIIQAFFALFRIYPDVVFSKGGFASVPTVIAAHFLRIPIVIHESDSKMGRANKLAAKYAYRIGVAFDSAAQELPPKYLPNVAHVGTPVRSALALIDKTIAQQALQLDSLVPTVLVLGGSLGSKRINDMMLTALPELVDSVNIIHQTGKDNFKEVEATSSIILEKSPNKGRYHAFPYFSTETLKQAASAADLIVSRAGTGTISEIAFWRKPAILIPIPESISHDQRTNAYSYAHTGGAVVLEEGNMTPHVLASEIRRIATDPQLAASMGEKGVAFGGADASRVIAEELVAIALSHETQDEVAADQAPGAENSSVR